MMHQKHFNLPNPQPQKTKYGLGQAQRFGLFAEKFILAELVERGHDARLLTDFNAPYDILVNDSLPIEVKVARPTNCYTGKAWRKRWQFCLKGGLDYLKADFIYILVLIDDNGEIHLFIIPSAFVATRQIISITSPPEKYSGQWAQYLNRWDYIDLVGTWRTKYQQNAYGQLSLFSGVTL